jgi:hypothetical protein
MLTVKHIAAGIIILALSSCGSDHKEVETVTEEVDTTEVAEQEHTTSAVEDTTKFKFDFAIANIPSPASSMEELASWNVPYDKSLLNEPKKSGEYTTEARKSINLGIYNIDMAYAMTQDKGEDVLRYMKQVVKMSDELGLKGAVSTMVGKRAESNLGSKDSLFRILDEIFVKSDSYLRSNERVYTAATLFAGSWLESLYLASRISEQVTDVKMKDRAKRHLWEQRFHLGNLINLLNDYKVKQECSDLVRDLKPIHEEIVAIKQPSELSDHQYEHITSQIVSLRNKITG